MENFCSFCIPNGRHFVPSWKQSFNCKSYFFWRFFKIWWDFFIMNECQKMHFVWNEIFSFCIFLFFVNLNLKLRWSNDVGWQISVGELTSRIPQINWKVYFFNILGRDIDDSLEVSKKTLIILFLMDFRHI